MNLSISGSLCRRVCNSQDSVRLDSGGNPELTLGLPLGGRETHLPSPAGSYKQKQSLTLNPGRPMEGVGVSSSILTTAPHAHLVTYVVLKTVDI